MNIDKTKQKLKLLSRKELNVLLEMALEEKEDRGSYTSNMENTPREQARDLSEFFGQAWIH